MRKLLAHQLSRIMVLVVLGLFVVFAVAVITTQTQNHRLAFNVPPKTAKATTEVTVVNDDDTSNPANEEDQVIERPDAVESEVPSTVNARCHVQPGNLPDPNCTPGMIDPNVTQENIHQTICVSGYSKKVRPPQSVTAPMKLQSMQQYGFTDSPHNYEYDHLVSLELGGATDDPANLWPEPGASPNPKDKVENTLHALVCSGAMPLAEAQRRIATDWHTALAGF